MSARKLAVALLVLLPTVVSAQTKLDVKPQATTDIGTLAMKSTALLFKQDLSGSLRMLCTTTAFEKSKEGYLFVSAAHCVGDDKAGRAADPGQSTFYITMDDPKNKTFYEAVPKGVGYQHRGDDFSYFEVVTKDELSFVPIGDENEEIVGGDVVNVSSPYGMGRQMFKGTISSLKLERPIIVDDINWKNAITLQMSGPGPGSSGSSIISKSQGKIVAFLVGSVGGTNVIAIPVHRFKEFRASVEKDKYKWYKGEEETETDEDSKDKDN